MKKLTVLALSAAPYLALAQGTGQGLNNIIRMISGIISSIIPILVALALIYFFWGLIKFILQSGDAKDEGKKYMIWGIIALFVMVSVWGIVNLLKESFGVQNTQVEVPTVPGL